MESPRTTSTLTARRLMVPALLLSAALLTACTDPAEEFAEQLEQQSDTYETLIADLEEDQFRHMNRSLRTLLLLEADPQRNRTEQESLCLKLSDSLTRSGDGVRGIQIDVLAGGSQAESEAPGKGLVAIWHATGEKLQWKMLADAPDGVAIPEQARTDWRMHESNWSFQNDTEDRHLRVRFYFDRSRLEAKLKRIRSRFPAAE